MEIEQTYRICTYATEVCYLQQITLQLVDEQWYVLQLILVTRGLNLADT